MRLIALSVGRPREVLWRGTSVLTSIFKTPVDHRIQVGKENLAGDQQSDLTVHGGADKAVYAYPAEHYPFWERELGEPELGWGAFGENFTTEGLLESEVMIGDRFRIGTAEFIVTQPRMPCFKLGIRFGRSDMVKRFHHSGRNGFYFSVLAPGDVGPGDAIERIARDEHGLSVADLVTLYGSNGTDGELLDRAIEHPALPASWREYFRTRSGR
jgi:MOSC domain-containing protein YiiM